MTDKALSLLGLALRGGNLAVGEEPVRAACEARRARLVLTAADAAEGSARRAEHWARAARVPWVSVPWDKGALGGALGRASCAVAALTDAGLAAALAQKLADADPQFCPLSEELAARRPEIKPNPRARRKPAVPET